MALVRQNALSLPMMNESWAETARNYEQQNMTEIDYWCSPAMTSTDPARHAELIGRIVQVAYEEYSNIVLYGTIKAIEVLTVEETFEKYLYSAGMPSPELLIRPGGEQRLSNFLLWQCAYAEFYFTDVLWPDFSKEELHRAIAAYQHRNRRFGGVG